MRNIRLKIFLCVMASALLMSLPWLVPHCGCFALVGFVPLLMAEYLATEYKARHFGLWIYICFVLWNAATTWWIKNATIGGAVFAVLANALQMAVIWWVFICFKKRIQGLLPYIFLACFWIAWERWYLQSAQISWPWLVLGNAFAQSTRSIQWYEFTGTLGGSLWVWVSNISIFWLVKWLCNGRWKEIKSGARAALCIWIAGVLAFPYAASAHIYHYYEEKCEGVLPVVIGQPNFDPYEKFQSFPRQKQNALLLGLYDEALAGDGSFDGLLLAPETFTDDVLLNDIESGVTFGTFQSFLRRHPGANLLFGASAYREYFQHSRPSILARQSRYCDTLWFMSYNSAIMTDTSRRAEVFHKSKLVVGTELTPYPHIFVPIDDKLGGLMGRCATQDHISCLHVERGGESIPVGTAVCYESVYGEYCTGYIREGARALAVITNDAWWGNTPGYRQHLSYSRLRAIETRRDLARCGNTGISAFIDQKGNILSQSHWWERTYLKGEINLNSRQTFFVRHGDICGKLCTGIFLLLLLFWAFLAATGRKMLLSR